MTEDLINLYFMEHNDYVLVNEGAKELFNRGIDAAKKFIKAMMEKIEKIFSFIFGKFIDAIDPVFIFIRNHKSELISNVRLLESKNFTFNRAVATDKFYELERTLFRLDANKFINDIPPHDGGSGSEDKKKKEDPGKQLAISMGGGSGAVATESFVAQSILTEGYHSPQMMDFISRSLNWREKDMYELKETTLKEYGLAHVIADVEAVRKSGGLIDSLSKAKKAYEKSYKAIAPDVEYYRKHDDDLGTTSFTGSEADIERERHHNRCTLVFWDCLYVEAQASMAKHLVQSNMNVIRFCVNELHKKEPKKESFNMLEDLAIRASLKTIGEVALYT